MFKVALYHGEVALCSFYGDSERIQLCCIGDICKTIRGPTSALVLVRVIVTTVVYTQFRSKYNIYGVASMTHYGLVVLWSL